MSKMVIHFVSNETVEISDYDEIENILEGIKCNQQFISLYYPNVVINLRSVTYVEILN